MAFKNFDPFTSFGGKIDPLSEIRNAGIITNGSVFWVKSASDVDYTTFKDQVGADILRDTPQEAIDKTRNDRNDYVMVVPADSNAVFGLGTALDLNKDRVHMIGVGFNKAKESYSVTLRGTFGTVPDSEVLAVTGDGCELAGVRVLGTLGTNDGGTMTNGVLYLAGADFWAHDCVVEDSTASWGTPPLVRGGGTLAHDARFDDCKITQTGGGNVESAGNAPLVLGGNGNKRWRFNNCESTMTPGSTTETFFTPGTGAKVSTMFTNCYFGCNGTSYAVTSAVRGSTTANNPVLLRNCTSFSVTVFGTDPNVFASPTLNGTTAGIHNPGIFGLGTSGIPAS